jgi:hypothetical protein
MDELSAPGCSTIWEEKDLDTVTGVLGRFLDDDRAGQGQPEQDS